jgi:hypothetical protein
MGGGEMEIGKPRRKITVEPLKTPAKEPRREEKPRRREKVPAR